MDKVNQAILASLAPSTRRSYAQKVGELSAFRQAAGLPEAWPIPVDHLLQFLLELKEAGRAASSLPGYMSAIAFVSKAAGCTEFTQDFRVRKMLEGMARMTPPLPDHRKPITPDMLKGLHQAFATLCSSSEETNLFRAALLTGFFGAYRPSELLASGKQDRSGRALQKHDLTWSDGEVALTLRQSKTDQRGFSHTTRLRESQDCPLCPVRALKEYLGASCNEQGYLFQHADGSPLTLFQFRALFRRGLRMIGADPKDFGLHSLRIGAASTAASLGMPAEAIQRIGRWHSSAYRRYIR